ncbi:ras-related protein Rab-26-like [Oncorhynchus tshawytscha]|uniref:small monomeric GTPase n=2 Tax=Oncorhynchus TaxID=8016 RepID=A0A8C7LZL9_ONCMY|nr:ras-related protein Rab-26-like [Oncorhynchus tshawytscha]XP_036795032.1 ras-related protein Rab-26-like [Oncorhynchus mykiss]XP_036797686.1 ras-related protein Rab-26 [Oncorhynchus mykiss]
MSRKKAGKGKNANSSPTTGIPTGNQKGETGKSTAGTGSVVQANGMVHPSRPSLSNSSEFYDIAFKVMLVGDSGVGKTCLLVRFKDGAFLAGSFISTVGIDFRNKVMNIDRLKVKLQIWDTAGQERFRSVTHAYYRDANALLLLYDVTNRTSFDNIKAWLTEIHDYAQQDVVLMLLGNKADATQQRVVKREDGERLAKEFGVPYMETSAKSGLNVELSFTAVAKELKHRSMKEPNEPKFKLQDYVNKEMKSAGCAC